MYTKPISQLLADSHAIVEKTLAKLTNENINNRISENTASVGFLMQHIAEVHLSFNRLLFGEPIDFTPRTLRTEFEPNVVFDVDEIKNMQQKGIEKIIRNTEAATDEMLNTEMKTFIGDKTHMYILFYLIHHNSYHLGQAELAIKKGKSY